tara:strand:- start:56 stop:520 length:465 start_codon:yes stop_codon:yes gene_type:complete
MSTLDIANNTTITQVLDPVTLTATANTTGLDTQFSNGSMLVVTMGESGDTLSGTVYWELILQESSDNSTWSAVTSATSVTWGSVNSSTGVFATIDAAAEDDAAFKIGYTGPERYVRVAVTKTGTHTNGTPIGALGFVTPIHKPSSYGNDGSPTG